MIDYKEVALNKEYRNRLFLKAEKQRQVDEANRSNRSFNADSVSVKAIMTVFTIIALFAVFAVFSGQTYASSDDISVETIYVAGDNQEGHTPKIDVRIAGWTLYTDFEQLLLDMSSKGNFPLYDSRTSTEPSRW